MSPFKPLCLVLAVAASGSACVTSSSRRAALEQDSAGGRELAAMEPPSLLVEPGLRFDVRPAEARVFVNGQPVGTAGGLREVGGLLPLPAGIHQVSIQLAGYVTWRAEVAVGENPEPIQVTLVQRP